MRQVFPFSSDRAVVRQFLRGKRVKPASPPGVDTNLIIKNGNILAWTDLNVAWIAAGDGSLYTKLLGGSSYYSSMRLIHFMLNELGQPDRRIEREENPSWDPAGDISLAPRWLYFIDGSPVDIDDPILIVGPLGLAAYRASPERVELDP
jgi:hypothetical protein